MPEVKEPSTPATPPPGQTGTRWENETFDLAPDDCRIMSYPAEREPAHLSFWFVSRGANVSMRGLRAGDLCTSEGEHIIGSAWVGGHRGPRMPGGISLECLGPAPCRVEAWAFLRVPIVTLSPVPEVRGGALAQDACVSHPFDIARGELGYAHEVTATSGRMRVWQTPAETDTAICEGHPIARSIANQTITPDRNATFESPYGGGQRVVLTILCDEAPCAYEAHVLVGHVRDAVYGVLEPDPPQEYRQAEAEAAASASARPP